MNTEIVYLNHDNASDLVLREDGVPVSLGSVTRVIVEIDSIEYDSDILGGSKIWWNEQVDYEGALVDALHFKIGQDLVSPVGRYDDCRIKVFDVSNPNGVVWTSSLVVYVQ